MAAIEADHYREEEAALRADPIIKAMAAEIKEGLDAGAVTMDEFVHETGTPKHGFMGGAGAEYRKRGGEKGRSIGGPARAVLAELRELRVDEAEVTALNATERVRTTRGHGIEE